MRGSAPEACESCLWSSGILLRKTGEGPSPTESAMVDKVPSKGTHVLQSIGLTDSWKHKPETILQFHLVTVGEQKSQVLKTKVTISL